MKIKLTFIILFVFINLGTKAQNSRLDSSYIWDTGNLSYKNLYIYDANNNQTSRLIQDWDGSSWVGNISLPFDRVENYTLKQLEGALYISKTMFQWENAIRDLYNNPTEELFLPYR